MDITINISETDKKLLENDLEDIQSWAQSMIEGKANNCWNRFQQEWTTRLMNDPSFTDPIPSNKEDFVALVISRPDYLNRNQRQSDLG
jgi:hypothetical protein